MECLYWVPLQIFLELQTNRDDTRIWWERLTFDYTDVETKRVHTIYGLTALFCVSAAAIALDRQPNFPYTPGYVKQVIKQGELIAVTQSIIALTQQEAVQIPAPTMQETARSKL